LYVQLEALEEKDPGTLSRVPHFGNIDPEVASDTEAPAPTKQKRGAASGPAAKHAREAPSDVATRKAEKEKQRLKQIYTSKIHNPTSSSFSFHLGKFLASDLPYLCNLTQNMLSVMLFLVVQQKFRKQVPQEPQEEIQAFVCLNAYYTRSGGSA
jgi:hypothetical protein